MHVRFVTLKWKTKLVNVNMIFGNTSQQIVKIIQSRLICVGPSIVFVI